MKYFFNKLVLVNSVSALSKRTFLGLLSSISNRYGLNFLYFMIVF